MGVPQKGSQNDVAVLILPPVPRIVQPAGFAPLLVIIAIIAIIVKGYFAPQFYDEEKIKMEKLNKLFEQKYGAIRGAQTKLANDFSFFSGHIVAPVI